MKKIGLIILWALLIIGMLTFFVTRKSYSVSLNEPRVFKDSLSLIKEGFCHRWGLMQYVNDKLYFVYWNEGVLIQYGIQKWEVEKKYGSKGRGPTENVNTIYYEIKEDSYVTYDSGKYSIQEVSFNDSLLFYQKIKVPLEQTIKVGDSFLFTGPDDTSDLLKKFMKFNMKTSVLEEIEVDAPQLKEQYSDKVYWGSFVKNKSYEVYYAFYYKTFFVFDEDFNFLYTQDMIYDVPRPRFKKVIGGVIPERGLTVANPGAFLDENNQLYILSNITEEKSTDYTVVDVYDVITREYMSSFKVPFFEEEKAREIVKKDNILYVLYENCNYSL